MDTEVATKEELVAEVSAEWRKLARLIDSLDPEEMEEPALENGWSIKDTLAHISSWEQYMVRWVGEWRAGREPTRPFTGDDWVDRVNEQVFNEHREVPLANVLDAFHRSHAGVEELLAELDPDLLFDPERVPWLQGSALWQLIAANTFWHYREHREEIAASLPPA